MPEGISKYATKYAKRRSLAHGAEHPAPISILLERPSFNQSRNWTWADFKPLDRKKVGSFTPRPR